MRFFFVSKREGAVCCLCHVITQVRSRPAELSFNTERIKCFNQQTNLLINSDSLTSVAQSVTLWFGVCWRIASGDIRLVDVLVALLKCWWCVQEHVFVISSQGGNMERLWS